ncbi:MAG TPA: DUF4198 domain-containing protein [Puia sp.]|nr:DUF4198 domain-containing protein [Puia sp.]
MKRTISFILVFLISIVLSAHEFWLQPDKFIYEPGDEINVRFMVGENFEGENWSGDSSKVQSLSFYQHNIEDDLSKNISGKGDSLQFNCYEEGNVMIAFSSKNSFLQLDAAKFNEYLKEDGLQNAIDYRQQHSETDSGSREYYQRSVKTLIQIGKQTDNIFSKQTDLPIDIIPISNPYLIKKNAKFSATIFFKKQLLSNALIKIWHSENNKTKEQELITNEKGEISFDVSPNGRWMISTVKMEHIDNDEKSELAKLLGKPDMGVLLVK